MKNGYESQLFTWEGWNEVDVGISQFDTIFLVKDLGPFKCGDKFAFAVLNFQESEFILYKDNNSEEYFKFKLIAQVEYKGKLQVQT